MDIFQAVMIVVVMGFGFPQDAKLETIYFRDIESCQAAAGAMTGPDNPLNGDVEGRRFFNLVAKCYPRPVAQLATIPHLHSKPYWRAGIWPLNLGGLQAAMVDRRFSSLEGCKTWVAELDTERWGASCTLNSIFP